MLTRLLRRLYWRLPPETKRRLGIHSRRIASGEGRGLKMDVDRATKYVSGDVEPPVQKALTRHLRPGDVLYDVGANVGFFTLIGGRVVGPSGHVYAFEPVPENADRIRGNARLNGFAHVSVVEKAVSDQEGEGELILTEHPGGATLAKADVETPPDAVTATTVDLISIDEWRDQHRVRGPDLVKIDVEGAEMNVIRGMVETIQRYRPVLLYEIDGGTEEGFEKRRRDVAQFVRRLGYDLACLAPSYTGSNWYVEHVVATPSESEN